MYSDIEGNAKDQARSEERVKLSLMHLHRVTELCGNISLIGNNDTVPLPVRIYCDKSQAV